MAEHCGGEKGLAGLPVRLVGPGCGKGHQSENASKPMLVAVDKRMDFLTSRGRRGKGRREVQEAFYLFFPSLVTPGCFLARMCLRVLSQYVR